MRILWQSYTDPGTEYLQTLSSTLKQLAAPDTEVDVVGLSPGHPGVHRLAEARCGHQVVTQNMDAAGRGYDAVVLGHFQETGLHELRSVLDIPVVGLGEASVHQAMMLGSGFGLITIDPGFLWYHRQQIFNYRLNGKFVGVNAMNTAPDLYFSAFEGDESARDDVVAQFREQAMQLVDRGAEVIIPAGGLPALLLWSLGSRPDLDGAVVIDPIGLTLGLAEMWTRLGTERVSPGRRGPFARPERSILTDYRDTFTQPSTSHHVAQERFA